MKQFLMVLRGITSKTVERFVWRLRGIAMNGKKKLQEEK